MLEVAQKYLQLKSGEYYKCFGKVDKVVGLTIESIGPKAKLNDLCMIFLDKERRDYVMSEVVGFKDSHIILMPFDNVEGVGVGCIVENTGHPLTVAVGDELLGHTVDGIGRVTDCDEKDLKLDSEYPIEAPPPDPMSREIISDVLPLGVKAVDGLITVGKGQRIGIFAGSGVGKSTLLGMFARNTKADINVIALIGERGREVREFRGDSLDKTREFSEIELLIIERILVICINLLQEPWQNVLDISPHLERIETNSQYAQIISPSEVIAIITMNIKIGDVEGLMNICLPYITLESVIDKLNTRYWYSNIQNHDETNYRNAIESLIQKSQIPVKAVLGKSLISVKDFSTLVPGDVIRLDTNVDDELDIYVGNIKKFTALPGSSGDKYAVRITSVVREEQ